MTQVLIWAAVGMVGVAAALTLWRVAAGPSALDRMVAGDVLVAVVMAAVALIAVVFRDTSGIPILLVLSMLAFTGAVSVARLLAPRETARQRFRRPSGEEPDLP